MSIHILTLRVATKSSTQVPANREMISGVSICLIASQNSPSSGKNGLNDRKAMLMPVEIPMRSAITVISSHLRYGPAITIGKSDYHAFCRVKGRVSKVAIRSKPALVHRQVLRPPQRNMTPESNVPINLPQALAM